MAALTQDNRQSILNKVFSGFIIKNQAVSCSIADLFDWIGCLDHLPGHDFVDQLSGSPEFASSLFNLDDDSGLDSDDLAFLIDLDAAHSAAIDTAKVRKYYRGLSCSLCELEHFSLLLGRTSTLASGPFSQMEYCHVGRRL